ncbi:hypothetical protein FGB62_112g11 [Gracilaria domingensis]|nr:hypothetical protein FGB62_112g11 [Gracilaria domingensis]
MSVMQMVLVSMPHDVFTSDKSALVASAFAAALIRGAQVAGKLEDALKSQDCRFVIRSSSENPSLIEEDLTEAHDSVKRLQMKHVLLARSDDYSILVENNNKLPTIKYCDDVVYFTGEICDPVRDKLEFRTQLNFRRHEGCLREDPMTVLEYKLRGLNLKGEKLRAWSRTGWLERATESIEKHQHGTGSCVLMVRVSSGLLFYMKCSKRQGWWNEVKVTQALGEVMLVEYETPFAIDFDLRWKLTREYGRSLPPGIFETDVDRAKRAMCRCAEIQKKSVSEVKELLERGIPKVDGKTLKAGINQVMENPKWFKAQREGMNEEQLEMYSDERK